MKVKIVLISLLFIFESIFALTPKQIAQKLSLSPASKAMKQWERVFKYKRKMKRYKIDSLSDNEKKILKEYLMNHAADSDTPEFAGDI